MEAYASIGVITAAAKVAGIDRQRHYEWHDASEAYRKAFDSAHEQACDRLETEAVRRGIQGWDEPVFGKGPGPHAGTIQVGFIRKYSDRMLEVMLKARRPERFRERFEHTGKDGSDLFVAADQRLDRFLVDVAAARSAAASPGATEQG